MAEKPWEKYQAIDNPFETRVQDEQGNIHVFPAGSTPEMIAEALHVQPPAPESGPWDKYKNLPPGFVPEINVPPGFVIENPFEQTAQAAPQSAVYPNVHPGEVEISKAPGGIRGWLSDLEGDIRYGGDRTFVGKILKGMGAQGINVGAQSGAATELAASVPLGAIHATQGIEQMVRDPKEGGSVNQGLKRYAGGVIEGTQLPAMITGAPAAAEVAEQAGAKAGKVVDAAKQAFSKTAVTKNMQSELGASLDRVASEAKLPASEQTSLSAKAAEIVGGLKKQAQSIYSELDKASGGRYQRFRDAIDELSDGLRNNTDPDIADKIKARLSKAQDAYANVQQELVRQGVNPATIKAADAKWSQAKALEQVGKKLKQGENLSGELKPGTPSVDTGLKNLKPNVLERATKGEAPVIRRKTVGATEQVGKVKRNQAIAKGAAKITGAGGGLYTLGKILGGKD